MPLTMLEIGGHLALGPLCASPDNRFQLYSAFGESAPAAEGANSVPLTRLLVVQDGKECSRVASHAHGIANNGSLANNGTLFIVDGKSVSAINIAGQEIFRHALDAPIYSVGIASDASFAACQTANSDRQDGSVLAFFDLRERKCLWKRANPRVRWPDGFEFDCNARNIFMKVPGLGRYKWTFDGVFVDEDHWRTDREGQTSDHAGRPISWRSKLLDYQPKLTKEALAILVSSLPERRVGRGNNGVLKLFIREALCRGDGTLTETGVVTAIASLPLDQQCRHLKVPLKKLEIAEPGRVEVATLKHLLSEGHKGGQWDALPVSFTIFAACFGWLLEKEVEIQGKSVRRYPPLSFAGFHFDVYAFKDELIKELSTATLETIANNLRSMRGERKLDSLLGAKKVVVQDRALSELGLVGLQFHGISSNVGDIDVVKAVIKSVGLDGLQQLAASYFSGELIFNAGWPDISLMIGGKWKGFEVKEARTRDKLHASQIIVLQDLRRAEVLNISVLQVYRPKL